jgi:hypothetical protein
MFIPDQDARLQITADKYERLADDYARANFRRNQRRRWRLQPDTAHELATRTRRWATRPQLETQEELEN